MNKEQQSLTDSLADLQDRQLRYPAFAVVDIRKYRYLPLFSYTGILIDVSLGGFKIELTSDLSFQPGQKLWLFIPLAPIGIYAPQKLRVEIECRWFDVENYKMGGVFCDLDRDQTTIIEQLIHHLSTTAE